MIVKESIYFDFDKNNAAPRKVVYNDDVDIEDLKVKESKDKEIEESKDEPLLEDLQRKEDQHDDLPKTWKVVRDHPL